MDMHVTLPDGKTTYTLEDVIVINFTDGVLTVIYDNCYTGVESTTFTQESLGEGRLTIC